MKRYILTLALAATLGIAYCIGAPKGKQPITPEVGKPLPAWSEGCLDIHFINSARGECCFYILPDGTTLLVDAGEVVSDAITVAQKPNDDVRPQTTYAKYIKHFLPNGAKSIDYCLATHLHIDHIGSLDTSTGKSPAGYHKSGLLALYDEVPYERVLDGLYPHYESYEITGQMALDWGTFMRWGADNKRFKTEQFIAGKEQIVMVNKPKKHKGFSIFNICANGQVWGLDKSGNTRLLGKALTTVGNSASCGFHLRYGNFDYIACGDLVGGPQNRVAFYFRDFIGKGKLEAFKCHHHLAGNSWGSKMQEVGFNPRVALNHCFTNNKPDIAKLMHVLPVVEGFYATNLHKEFLSSPEVKANKLVDKITAYNGHIVLRVMPGGKCFQVYMLDDSNFEYRVKFISGVYYSK